MFPCIIVIMFTFSFALLLGIGIGFPFKRKESEKRIQELEDENIALKQQLYEVVENPDSVKSIMIKSAIRLNISTEKMIWR